MTEYLHVTFGSKDVLQNVRNNNLERGLLLMSDDSDRQKYELLEKTTDKNSVFAMPVTYEILASHGGTDELRGWMNFTFIRLNDLERDNFIRRYRASKQDIETPGFISSYILQKTTNAHELVILSTWRLKENWSDWQESTDFPLHRYEHAQYNLYRKQLSFAALAKQKL